MKILMVINQMLNETSDQCIATEYGCCQIDMTDGEPILMACLGVGGKLHRPDFKE